MCQDKSFRVKLVTFSDVEAEREISFSQFKDGVELLSFATGLSNILGNILSINSKINPWHKFGNDITKKATDLLLNRLKRIKKEGYYPDVIIMDWTEITLNIDKIKRLFPKSKYIATEQDVTFQRYERKVLGTANPCKRKYYYIQYKNIKKRELIVLSKTDAIVVFNFKDKKYC